MNKMVWPFLAFASCVFGNLCFAQQFEPSTKDTHVQIVGGQSGQAVSLIDRQRELELQRTVDHFEAEIADAITKRQRRIECEATAKLSHCDHQPSTERDGGSSSKGVLPNPSLDASLNWKQNQEQSGPQSKPDGASSPTTKRSSTKDRWPGLDPKHAEEFHRLRLQYLHARSDWKTKDVVTSAVFDAPVQFVDPAGAGAGYVNGAILKEGMRFTATGRGQWQLSIPYIAGASPAEIRLQIELTMPGNQTKRITIDPICLPGKEHCSDNHCSSSQQCASCAQPTIIKTGYSPVLDRYHGVFKKIARSGYAVYTGALPAAQTLF